MRQPPGRLILASRSPRRRQLLEEAGYRFEVIPPDEAAESGEVAGESPAELVARLARQKAADVVRRVEPAIHAEQGVRAEPSLVLGCDTVAECDGRILGKPADRDDARAMLRHLSGREHRVLSGLCLWRVPGGRPDVGVAITTLRMDPLDEARLAAYLDGGQWSGKAGAFGYQDGLDWLHVMEGSPSNVVGLPMELLAEMLRRA